MEHRNCLMTKTQRHEMKKWKNNNDDDDNNDYDNIAANTFRT